MKQNIDEGLLSDMGYKLFKRAVCSKLKKAGFDLEQYADQIEDWCQDWYQDGFDASDAFASLRDTLIRNGAVNEDFSMGVGAPCGLDQGIPHGGDCKGCNPCRVAMVGHPVSKPPRSAALALTPGYWLNQIPKKKKKKVKKMKKRNLRKEAYEYLRPLTESTDVPEEEYTQVMSKKDSSVLESALQILSRLYPDVTAGSMEIEKTPLGSYRCYPLFNTGTKRGLEIWCGLFENRGNLYKYQLIENHGKTHIKLAYGDNMLKKWVRDHLKSTSVNESYGSDFEDFKEEVIEAMGINRAIAKKLVNKFEDDIIAEFESTMDADKIAYDIVEYYYDKIG